MRLEFLETVFERQEEDNLSKASQLSLNILGSHFVCFKKQLKTLNLRFAELKDKRLEVEGRVKKVAL
jgi:hypothetical protein